MVGALAWLTFVGYDTRVVDPYLKTGQGCREANVEGQLLGDVSAWNGGIEVRGLPPGDVVLIHRRLFHSTTYSFLAANGQRIPLHRVPACTGP